MKELTKGQLKILKFLIQLLNLVRKIAEEIEVNMIPFDEYKKIMKKAQRKEQLEMVKSIFSKI